MIKKDLIIVVLVSFCLVSALLMILPTRSSPSSHEYDPWADITGPVEGVPDGTINMRDIGYLCDRFSTSGDPITRAAILYDSDWTNITDKCGQHFNITHNLNSTDLIVDITGKTTSDGGVHQVHYGLTCYTSGWSRTYGGMSDDFAWSVVQTSDGGYVLGGETHSSGAGGGDFWLIKTDPFGLMEWSRTYGGTDYDHAEEVVQTSDGGYALAGFTRSFGAGMKDFYLVKTDSNGNMQWNKTYGGTGIDDAWSIIQTSDGGYTLAGYTYYAAAGYSDFLLIKTEVESGLAWTSSTVDTITLYRGATDAYWNFVRVRIWKIKENP